MQVDVYYEVATQIGHLWCILSLLSISSGFYKYSGLDLKTNYFKVVTSAHAQVLHINEKCYSITVTGCLPLSLSPPHVLPTPPALAILSSFAPALPPPLHPGPPLAPPLLPTALPSSPSPPPAAATTVIMIMRHLYSDLLHFKCSKALVLHLESYI